MRHRRGSRVAAWCAGAAACVSLVMGGAGMAGAAGPKAAVKIVNYRYKPKNLTVVAGTKVIWTNKDFTGHTTRFDDFGSPNLGAGDKWSHKFLTVGTFKYYCVQHPDMTAKVIVTE